MNDSSIIRTVHEKANPPRGGDAKPRASGIGGGRVAERSLMTLSRTCTSRSVTAVHAHGGRPGTARSRSIDLTLLRYAALVTMAAVLAVIAAVGASAIDAPAAEGATISVKTCNGGTIELNSNEKRTLGLHNQARANWGLARLCVDSVLPKAGR